MPIQACSIDGKKGYRWGEHGKCYVGPRARARALQQARAILANRLLTRNVFCPTGEGGGVDPTCSPIPTGAKLENIIQKVRAKINCSVSGSGFCRPAAIALWKDL